MTCLPCALISPEAATGPEPGVAGRSAKREYERRKRTRENRARRRLGRLGVGLVRLMGDPQHVTAWKKGAAGESRAAKRLERHLAGRGVRLLHDRVIPGTRANIDHLAVGPGGVTVIDAKNYKGKVRIERRGGLFSRRRAELRIDGSDRTKLVEGVRRQIEVIQAALSAAHYGAIPVEGALCFVNGEGLPLFGRLQLDGVTIDGPRRSAKLAARPGDLDSERVDAIHRELAARFPAA